MQNNELEEEKNKRKQKLQGVGRLDFMTIIDYQLQPVGLSTQLYML